MPPSCLYLFVFPLPWFLRNEFPLFFLRLLLQGGTSIQKDKYELLGTREGRGDGWLLEGKRKLAVEFAAFVPSLFKRQYQNVVSEEMEALSRQKEVEGGLLASKAKRRKEKEDGCCGGKGRGIGGAGDAGGERCCGGGESWLREGPGLSREHSSSKPAATSVLPARRPKEAPNDGQSSRQVLPVKGGVKSRDQQSFLVEAKRVLDKTEYNAFKRAICSLEDIAEKSKLPLSLSSTSLPSAALSASLASLDQVTKLQMDNALRSQHLSFLSRVFLFLNRKQIFWVFLVIRDQAIVGCLQQRLQEGGNRNHVLPLIPFFPTNYLLNLHPLPRHLSYLLKKKISQPTTVL